MAYFITARRYSGQTSMLEIDNIAPVLCSMSLVSTLCGTEQLMSTIVCMHPTPTVRFVGVADIDLCGGE
jgi:hypothetical protein